MGSSKFSSEGYSIPVISVKELEEYLRFHIPISAYMGVQVLDANFDHIQLKFPLEPNINHRQSVFGGSESSAAILSAWSLLWVRFKLNGISAKLVIQENTMEYSIPITGEFIAETDPITDVAWRKFSTNFERRGIARIDIAAHLVSQGKLCARFSGTFVAIRIES